MIKLTDILLEIGELPPYPYQYFGDLKQASFHSDNANYEVTFYNPGNLHKNDMEIEFSAQTKDGGGQSISATNLHDQYRVMSTIVAISKRAIDEKKPTIVYFYTDDPRRIKLYKRYITPLLHDYDIHEETDTEVVMRKKGWLQRLTNILREEQYGKRLVVFDFDDTLATSEAIIHVTKADGTKMTMSPAEYATYEEVPGDKFDFKEFNSMLKNPQTIDRNMKLLKKAISNPQNKVTILTARSHGFPMKHFFKTQHNIDPYIVPVGNGDPQTKARWIEAEIKKGYNSVFFIDDSQKNVDAVAGLKDKYPNIKLKSVLA